MTKYRNLAECFYERLPPQNNNHPDTNRLLESEIPHSEPDSPTLSDEQVSLLASDLQTPIDNNESY